MRVGWSICITNTQLLILSGTKSSYRLKLRETGKQQQSSTKYDMNDCLLESENFQITKSDNNKYLLLPVKKQEQTEKFVLKECGKDMDSDTVFYHSHTFSFSFSDNYFLFDNKIRKNFKQNYLSHHVSNVLNVIHQTIISCNTLKFPS
jgi:hypothetical protein